jgi:hypothetical protein
VRFRATLRRFSAAFSPSLPRRLPRERASRTPDWDRDDHVRPSDLGPCPRRPVCTAEAVGPTAARRLLTPAPSIVLVTAWRQPSLRRLSC